MMGDQTLNGTVDYQLFKAQYVNLRDQFSETFNKKVFAENIEFKGKRMRLSDESTYEMVHSGLHALELSDDIAASRIGNNAIISDSGIASPSQVRRLHGTKQTITGSTMAYTSDQSHSKKSMRETK